LAQVLCFRGFANVMDQQVQKAKDLLKDEQLFSHLSKIVASLVAERPDRAFEDFEALSRNLKAASSQPEQKWAENEIVEWKAQVDELTSLPAEEGGEPILAVSAAVPDFMSEAELLKHAGVLFGNVETWHMHLALRRLGRKEGVTMVRFWGKILGSTSDYIIAETATEGEDAGEEATGDDAPEPSGAAVWSVNKFTYWVAKDAFSDWVKLPPVNPRQIQAARGIKKMLSGNLNADVVSHPHFPGQEMHLLRAQIARITAATTVCPAGYFSVNEEDAEAELTNMTESEDPPYAFPKQAVLGSTDRWVHAREHILKNGKSKYPELEEPGEDDEVPEAYLKQKAEMAADPMVVRLRPLTSDEAVPSGEAWSIRQRGDPATYMFEQRDAENPEKILPDPKSYLVTVVKSNRWPGAVTVSAAARFLSVYVGYGFKAGVDQFFPGAPPPVMSEPEERIEQTDPNFPDVTAQVQEDEEGG